MTMAAMASDRTRDSQHDEMTGHEIFTRVAIEEAKIGLAQGEQPVGAVTYSAQRGPIRRGLPLACPRALLLWRRLRPVSESALK